MTVIPRVLSAPVAMVLLATCICTPDHPAWRTVDAGFNLEVPSEMRELKLQGIDTHIGAFRSRTMRVSFDEVDWVLMPQDATLATIRMLRKEKLRTIEAGSPLNYVTVIDGRLAYVREEHEKKGGLQKGILKESMTAVIYDPAGGYLSITVEWRSNDGKEKAMRILRSIKFPHKTH